MEKDNVKITRYYSADYPNFYVDIVKQGNGRKAYFEAWLSKDESGVADLMFGLVASCDSEFLEIVE